MRRLLPLQGGLWSGLTGTAAGVPRCRYLALPRRWCSSAAPSASMEAGTTSASSSAAAPSTPGKVKIHIHSETQGQRRTVEVSPGVTLMEAIRDVAKMDMEAACDGTCACSTCHVIFSAESYKKLRDPPSEDEMDMLDLAPAVTKTSRLSCQVQISPELEDITVTIPNEMENQLSY